MTNVPNEEAAAAAVGGSTQGIGGELEEALIVEMGGFASDLGKRPWPPLALPVSNTFEAKRAPRNPQLWEGDQA